MKLSVCIPCHVDHFHHLKDIISDLNNQTRPPDEIIIYIKPINKNHNLDLNFNVKSCTNLIFIEDENYTTMAYSKNRCAEKSTGDLILFMDCDDRINIHKLEFVERFFLKNNDCDVLVHGYYINDLSHLKDSIDMNNMSYEICIDDENTLGVKNNIGVELHHAHSSFRRDSFIKCKYPEKDSAYRADDSILLKHMVKKQYNIYFTNNKLISFTIK